MWGSDQRSSERYQYFQERLRELEQPMDREPEPHTKLCIHLAHPLKPILDKKQFEQDGAVDDAAM